MRVKVTSLIIYFLVISTVTSFAYITWKQSKKISQLSMQMQEIQTGTSLTKVDSTFARSLTVFNDWAFNVGVLSDYMFEKSSEMQLPEFQQILGERRKQREEEIAKAQAEQQAPPAPENQGQPNN